ncbi:MAG TPA: ATP-binding protein [Gemmataceae bacterium]|nr:ATP-binding protein [Gemmataceae bacterium]
MTLPLRFRIVLIVVPLLIVFGILGGTAAFLLHRIGVRIDAILRENYDSVFYMERLNEALERIDSSFQFALAGEEKKAKQQYEKNWPEYEQNLSLEQINITLEGEGELVSQLTQLTRRYRQQGDRFYARPATAIIQRRHDYFGENLAIVGARTVAIGSPPLVTGPLLAAGELMGGEALESAGLLDIFNAIKHVSGQIRALNADNMKEASREARRTVRSSLIGFAIGLTAAVLLGALLAWHTIRALLRPIQAVTQSAVAIGLGNLDQVVPVMTRDELGQLAGAFNTMARQLREYRQTNYARLLRAQRTSQATIDAFPDPVLVVDSQGSVELANPAARRVLGVEARGGDAEVRILWHPPEAIRSPLTEALVHQRPYLPEGFERVIVLTAEGQEQFFLPHILPIQDPYGNTLGAAVQLQDVTRFRLLDQVKSDLVATVSHELKTPLTSIRLVLHLLLEETLGPLSPKQTELLLDARDNAERLLARVNNLLDLTRLESGRAQLDLRPEAPAALLQAAADGIRPRAEDKDVTITVELPPDLPNVVADAQRLGHALGNLLDNALTYTDRGGKITLSAAAADNGVTLIVADTGMGIPEEYLPRIFDRFFRVPNQSQGSGTGLGLAIVREIIMAHGGTVSCASALGAGTEFRLTLPIWNPASGVHGQESEGDLAPSLTANS